MSLLRVTAQRAPLFTRAFSASASRGDLIKDLYIKELKGYKAPAKAADAHKDVVRNFNAPSSPSAPQIPSDLASEMSKFDSTEPQLGSKPAAKKASQAEDGAGNAQEYLQFLEADLPKNAHH